MNEDNIKALHDLDESTTLMASIMPTLWWNLKVNLVKDGFSEEEAMSLLRCYIFRDGMYGVHIHKD